MSSVESVRGRVPAAWRRTHPSVLVLGALMALAAVVVYRKGAGLTFYYDEWTIVMERRDWDVEAFLKPHGEHIVLLPVAVFKLLFVTVGLDAYWAFRLVAIAAHLVCVALIFTLLRRRVDGWLALIGAVAILFLGSAWQDLLWPFQIAFTGAIAAGLGMLAALDARGRGRDVAAAALLLVALGFSSLGIPLAVAAVVEVLLRRPRLVSDLWIPIAPLVLYAIWYATYGQDGFVAGTILGTPALLRQNLPAAPGYAADMVASGFGALVGLGLEWGRPLALVAVGALAVRISRPIPISPRLVGLLVAAVAYWGLTASFRGHLKGAAESRYTYLSAVLLLLIAAELFRDTRATRRGLAVLGVLLAAATLANFGKLREGSLTLQDWSAYVAPALGAVELAEDVVDPSFQPDPVRAPPVRAGRYLDAVRQYGSPGDSPEEIRRRPEPYRQAADAVLIQALRIGPFATRAGFDAGSPPTVVAAEGNVRRLGPCIVFSPAQVPASVEVEADSDVFVTLSGKEPAEYRLRTLADGYPAGPHGTLTAGSPQALPLGRKDLPRPWWLRVTTPAEVQICTPE